MSGVQVSTVSDFRANLIQGELKLNKLRTNNILRKEEWKAFDEAVVDIFRHNLVGIEDLRAAGLTRNLGGLGTMIDEWEMISDMEEANADMSGITPGQRSQPEFELTGVPIPIIHKDFQINIRRLLASRKLGASLDTTMAEIAARKVRDKLEEMIFNGLPEIRSKQFVVHGYTTFPARNQMPLSGIWGQAGADPIGDVLSMIEAMNDNNMNGPYNIYIPRSFWANLYADYDVTKPGTIAERILQIPDIKNIKQVSPLDGSAASAEVVMVQLSREVVDLSIGQDVTNVEWETLGGMQTNFKVMCAMAPRLKRDEENRCGIVHAWIGQGTT
jgi:uncharacterized linocin/CFP29 family protein